MHLDSHSLCSAPEACVDSLQSREIQGPHTSKRVQSNDRPIAEASFSKASQDEKSTLSPTPQTKELSPLNCDQSDERTLSYDASDELTITSDLPPNCLPSFSELNRHLEFNGHQKWDVHPQSPHEGINLPGINELFPHLRLSKG
ncbi:hypothetical protein AAF712_007984 [Marasmius tenuissimus]|uniref:Uncharacterized protein n=1 Tax=Marasmius tenuissimus TaxID=585030 RepID=A0ABR2ZUG4_9AGAR